MSGDPNLRMAAAHEVAIKVLRVGFGGQGFGSPFGKPMPGQMGRALSAIGLRVIPTDVATEQQKGKARVQSRVEKSVKAKQDLDLRERAFRQTVEAEPD